MESDEPFLKINRFLERKKSKHTKSDPHFFLHQTPHFGKAIAVYGRVFESSHEHLELLHKMDGTRKFIFSAIMRKNGFRFLLSMIRLEDKATKTRRRSNNKSAAFPKI